MSMRDSANRGFILEAKAFEKYVPKASLTKFKRYLLDRHLGQDSCKGLFDIISRVCKKKGWALPQDCFSLRSEDSSDDLEHGVHYLEFAESDLFEREPTRLLVKMRAAVVEPQDRKWCTWG